jgi:hypothetical protein
MVLLKQVQVPGRRGGTNVVVLTWSGVPKPTRPRSTTYCGAAIWQIGTMTELAVQSISRSSVRIARVSETPSKPTLYQFRTSLIKTAKCHLRRPISSSEIGGLDGASDGT